MPVSSVRTDPVARTLTAVGDYPVPVERLFDAFVDPRKLERFWGPPEWPATFLRHEMRAGGFCEYLMTGPNGEQSRGYWRVLTADAPHRIEVLDGFAAPDGTPMTDLPETHMSIEFTSTATGSRFVAVSTFASVEAMEKLVSMGMVEGLSSALAQLDDVLADLRAHAATLSTALELVDDTHVRIVRDVRGNVLQVWRAHHEAALVQRWMLGPPGWTMPVCEVATTVGAGYRYEWASDGGDQRFGFVGELLASEPPRRAVTTERMLGTDGPTTHNELLLAPRPGGMTRIELRITYPSREVRDMILATGMVDGMEQSYARLEGVASSDA